jgi:hypothetical protein
MRTAKFEDVPNLPEIYNEFTQEMAERVIEAKLGLPQEVKNQVGNKLTVVCKALADEDFSWEYMQHLLVACYPGEFDMEY